MTECKRCKGSGSVGGFKCTMCNGTGDDPDDSERVTPTFCALLSVSLSKSSEDLSSTYDVTRLGAIVATSPSYTENSRSMSGTWLHAPACSECMFRT